MGQSKNYFFVITNKGMVAYNQSPKGPNPHVGGGHFTALGKWIVEWNVVSSI